MWARQFDADRVAAVYEQTYSDVRPRDGGVSAPGVDGWRDEDVHAWQILRPLRASAGYLPWTTGSMRRAPSSRSRCLSALVLVGHSEDLLPAHLADKLRMALLHVLLDRGDELVLAFGLDVRAAVAVDDLHETPPSSMDLHAGGLSLGCPAAGPAAVTQLLEFKRSETPAERETEATCRPRP